MTIQTEIKPAAVASRVEAVQQRHRHIDDLIIQEHRRPMPDAVILQSLKREKLRLKDELSRYDGLLRNLSRGRRNA